MCAYAVAKIIRFLDNESTSTQALLLPATSFQADALEASAMQLIVRMNICDQQLLFREIELMNNEMLKNCPYRGCMKKFPDIMLLSHVCLRLVPIFLDRPPSVLSIKKESFGKVMKMLKLAKLCPKYQPDGELCNDTYAILWILKLPENFRTELAKLVEYPNPVKNEEDVLLLFAAIKARLFTMCDGISSLPSDCSGWEILQDMLPLLPGHKSVTESNIW